MAFDPRNVNIYTLDELKGFWKERKLPSKTFKNVV